MQPYVTELREAVTRATPLLLALGDGASARPIAAGGWSPRQIIGHLIDSASNNHGRFVRAQLEPDLVCAGYAQDEWVQVQRYLEHPWRELVELWAAYNRHLARVMQAAPEPATVAPRVRHNLHEIAFSPVSPDRPATLGYLMQDYVSHLKHHLRQILGADWLPSPGEGGR